MRKGGREEGREGWLEGGKERELGAVLDHEERGRAG
jgi:hypothetical protein